MIKKKIFSVVGLGLLLISCAENSGSTKNVVDSTVNKLDSTAEKVGEKAKEGFDTLKAKAKDVKESLDKTFDKKKDK